MPLMPGAGASPVPRSTAEGPSSGISVAATSRTSTATARPAGGRRRGAANGAPAGEAVTSAVTSAATSAAASPPGSADGRMELTTRSSPGVREAGNS